MMVQRLAWIAHRLVSSIRMTRYISAASCKAWRAVDWNLTSGMDAPHISKATSLTSRAKGSLGISMFVDFWYFLISMRALVPGLYLWPLRAEDVEACCCLGLLIGVRGVVDGGFDLMAEGGVVAGSRKPDESEEPELFSAEPERSSAVSALRAAELFTSFLAAVLAPFFFPA